MYDRNIRWVKWVVIAYDFGNLRSSNKILSTAFVRLIFEFLMVSLSLVFLIFAIGFASLAVNV